MSELTNGTERTVVMLLIYHLRYDIGILDARDLADEFVDEHRGSPIPDTARGLWGSVHDWLEAKRPTPRRDPLRDATTTAWPSWGSGWLIPPADKTVTNPTVQP